MRAVLLQRGTQRSLRSREKRWDASAPACSGSAGRRAGRHGIRCCVRGAKRLRICGLFSDEEDKMNLSVQQTGGSV